jgi:putative DNA primase/helicase
LDFRAEANLDENDKLSQKHQTVLTIREVLRVAKSLNCGLAKSQDFIYSYNGEFWKLLDREALEIFLGNCSAKLGVDEITASYHKFKSELHKQFLSIAHLPKPETETNTVLINLRNGTFEITKDSINIRDFDRADFLTYQLDFDYDQTATCPKWQNFLNEVLPDVSRQNLLAEYIGFVFARHLKLEKTLILYGTGANGKSVIFEVINALLGKENVSNYSLESLCGDYYRAMLANKILNYSSEISNRLQAEKFKQLTSGEPIEARLPYGQPMTLTNYARLAFNCNELPKDVEHSEAFFRRFLIIPFDVTVPEEKRNPNLSKEIIETELSGVFNWMLEGLNRLLKQNRFSPCDAVQKAVANYRRESDSVAMFLEDEHFTPDADETKEVKLLFAEYKNYCLENNYRPLGRNNFSKRLEANNIRVQRQNIGLVAFVRRIYV